MSRSRFSIADAEPWRATIEAAPSEDRKVAFWDAAVPSLARLDRPDVTRPCTVVVRVQAPASSGRRPGGPVGRAKTALDALHDERSSGPKYQDVDARSPIINDDPMNVSSLAVEVAAGEPRTEYELGSELALGGTQLALVLVEAAAPNDVWAEPGERERIHLARMEFRQAVHDAFSKHAINPRDLLEAALVVRHHPQRDEDNTWSTWIQALCGIQRGSEHWSMGAPLTGWIPSAIASVADSTMDSPVAYEIWG
jgi:hypothetical protein